MGSVFISHARRDRQVARSVADRLREQGHDAYVDDGPAAGLDWWRQTLAHIEEAELFLALTSPAYDSSEACRLEAAHAATVGLEVVAVPATADAAARAEDALAPPEPEPDLEPDLEPPEPSELEEEPVEPATVPQRGVLGEAAVAVALLVVLVVVVVVVLRSTGSEPSPRGASPAVERLSALRAQVAAAGDDPTAPLPLASCGARDGSRLYCRRPAPNVQSVTLTSYADAELLQEAYLREVQRLSGQSYRANDGPCDGSVAEGEQGWSDAGVPGAAGRAYCVVSSQVIQLVWTQGDHVLGVVTGQPASIVAAWWVGVRTRLATGAG